MHRGKVHRSRTAATSNYPRPAIARETRILGHQFRRSAVLDLTIDKLRDTAVCFGDQNIRLLGVRAYCKQGADQIGCAHTAVGTVGRKAGHRLTI